MRVLLLAAVWAPTEFRLEYVHVAGHEEWLQSSSGGDDNDSEANLAISLVGGYLRRYSSRETVCMVFLNHSTGYRDSCGWEFNAYKRNQHRSIESPE